METLRKRLANRLRHVFLRIDYLFWSLGRHKQLPADIKSILVIEMKYLGDVIAITPALRALRAKYPISKIDLLTMPGSVEILVCNPHINKIIAYQPGENISLQAYDMLVVFHAGTNKRARQIAKFTKHIPFKIGVTNAGILSSYYPRLDRKVKYSRGFKHIVEENLDVVRLIGADTADKSYELKHTKSGATQPPVVILSPGSKKVMEARNPSHMWPAERWAEVADYLVNKYDANIIITGTESESRIAADIIRRMCFSAINTCGRLSTQDLIQEISNSNLLISVDSGPVHIAAAVGTPVIDLMGPQDPVIWGPWTDKAIILYHDEVCTKCKRIECSRRQPDCMLAITVKEVKWALDKILTNGGKKNE